MRNELQTIPAAGENSRFKLAALVAGAAMLSLGGSLAATGKAEARACISFGNGIELCVDTPDVDNSINNSERYIQTIGITTHIGSNENLVQSYKPNTTRPGITRVCLNNSRGGRRSLVHKFGKGIGNLSARPGGQSCANFPSNARVRFTPYTGRNRATPSKTLVYSLSAYAGGLLRLTWQ